MGLRCSQKKNVTVYSCRSGCWVSDQQLAALSIRAPHSCVLIRQVDMLINSSVSPSNITGWNLPPPRRQQFSARATERCARGHRSSAVMRAHGWAHSHSPPPVNNSSRLVRARAPMPARASLSGDARTQVSTPQCYIKLRAPTWLAALVPPPWSCT